MYGQGLTPSTPAKEYIRLNGQIIAIQNAVGATATTGGGVSGSRGRQYAQAITTPQSLPPTTDQNNLPVLLTGTYSFLATTADGGQIQNAYGYDIVFTSNQAGTNRLNWEVENYQASTGAATYWIRVPVLSHTADTTVYMLHENASITTDQSNKTGTWDSGYGAVWHLGKETASSLVGDSTNNYNAGGHHGGVAVAGEIDTGFGLNNGEFIPIPDTPSRRPQASIMAQSIVNFAGINGENYQNEWLNGSLDELRISSVARSADWIATEYNNQSNPPAFAVVGAQTARH